MPYPVPPTSLVPMRRSLLLTSLAIALVARPAAAQATLTTDASLVGSFVWRGLTFVNRPVVQGDLGLAAPLLGGTVSSGIWANAEPADYTGATALRMVQAGKRGPAVTVLAPWADWTVATGRLATTVGGTAYWYPRASTGFLYAETFNTSEIYAKVAVTAPLSPRLAIYQDVRKVKGTYAEASVAQPLAAFVPAAKRIALSLGATVGASWGEQPKGAETWLYAHDGLAYVDLSASGAVALRAVTVAPTIHLVFDHDEATQLDDALGAVAKRKVWAGATLSWARALGTAK